MKCLSLFFGKNKKNTLNCHLLNVLQSMQRVKNKQICTVVGG